MAQMRGPDGSINWGAGSPIYSLMGQIGAGMLSSPRHASMGEAFGQGMTRANAYLQKLPQQQMQRAMMQMQMQKYQQAAALRQALSSGQIKLTAPAALRYAQAGMVKEALAAQQKYDASVRATANKQPGLMVKDANGNWVPNKDLIAIKTGLRRAGASTNILNAGGTPGLKGEHGYGFNNYMISRKKEREARKAGDHETANLWKSAAKTFKERFTTQGLGNISETGRQAMLKSAARSLTTINHGFTNKDGSMDVWARIGTSAKLPWTNSKKYASAFKESGWALLRLESGAVVNKEEALDLVDRYQPGAGDNNEVARDKLARFNWRYFDLLKARGWTKQLKMMFPKGRPSMARPEGEDPYDPPAARAARLKRIRGGAKLNSGPASPAPIAGPRKRRRSIGNSGGR